MQKGSVPLLLRKGSCFHCHASAAFDHLHFDTFETPVCQIVATHGDAQPSVTTRAAEAARLERRLHHVLLVRTWDVERIALSVAEPVDDRLSRATFYFDHLLNDLRFAHLFPQVTLFGEDDR